MPDDTDTKIPSNVVTLILELNTRLGRLEGMINTGLESINRGIVDSNKRVDEVHEHCDQVKQETDNKLIPVFKRLNAMEQKQVATNVRLGIIIGIASIFGGALADYIIRKFSGN